MRLTDLDQRLAALGARPVHRDAILQALEHFDPAQVSSQREARVLKLDEEIGKLSREYADLDEVWKGLAACYASLVDDVRTRYGVQLRTVASLGISGMMHGYVALDADGNLLVPFRTWRRSRRSARPRARTRRGGCTSWPRRSPWS